MASVEAKKHLQKKAERRATQNPLVQECEKKCIFENDDNSWCIDATPPFIKIGWDWEQASGRTSEAPIADWWQI